MVCAAGSDLTAGVSSLWTYKQAGGGGDFIKRNCKNKIKYFLQILDVCFLEDQAK